MLLRTGEDVALALREEARIAVVQGSAFGLEPCLRIAYARDEATRQQACNAIATGLAREAREAQQRRAIGEGRSTLERRGLADT